MHAPRIDVVRIVGVIIKSVVVTIIIVGVIIIVIFLVNRELVPNKYRSSQKFLIYAMSGSAKGGGETGLRKPGKVSAYSGVSGGVVGKHV